MDKQTMLRILRNPYGWSRSEQREARIMAAEMIEALDGEEVERLWERINHDLK
ncbi:MAG: hypothetical protein M0P69_05940 [Bacteroidales bacterium]|nr:hypothetical protein [Bacteroidales bacterium]